MRSESCSSLGKEREKKKNILPRLKRRGGGGGSRSATGNVVLEEETEGMGELGRVSGCVSGGYGVRRRG